MGIYDPQVSGVIKTGSPLTPASYRSLRMRLVSAVMSKRAWSSVVLPLVVIFLLFVPTEGLQKEFQ
jgi:hypothetical protein